MGRSDSLLVLPAWIPVEAWKGYEEMRSKIKKPLTTYAKKIAIKKLNALRLQGNDPIEVLEQSIFNSWQGLFPIREVGPALDFDEENRRAIRRVFGKSAN